MSEPVDTTPEAVAITAAHPLNTGRHDLYAEAMRLVSARYNKGELVELVNWLLAERDRLAAAVAEARREGMLEAVKVALCVKSYVCEGRRVPAEGLTQIAIAEAIHAAAIRSAAEEPRDE